MKYIVMLCDGMADYPLKELNGKTPMAAAFKPNMERLAKKATAGIVKTVPESLNPGSDVANLSAMGYDPVSCYTGRSPLEAMSIGIDMAPDDIAFRCNLVTLSDDEPFEKKVMADYSAQEITTAEAAEIIKAVNEAFENDIIKFYSGVSYRHCMIWHRGPNGLGLTPPHDISDRVIGDYLPKNDTLLGMMKKSYDVLKNHPVNIERKKRGLNPANAIWLWGEGTRPAIPNFKEMFGLKGSVISAVDLIKGIGITAGLDVINVEGATGNITTNFANKGKAALKSLVENGNDYVYIHVEAPDECGHRGEIDNKVKSIELIDRDIVGPLTKGLEEAGEDYTIMVLPDHPTPISTKTHARDAVPFIIYRSNEPVEGIDTFSEEAAAKTGLYIPNGPELSRLFLRK